MKVGGLLMGPLGVEVAGEGVEAAGEAGTWPPADMAG